MLRSLVADPAVENAMAFLKSTLEADAAAYYRVDQNLSLTNFRLANVYQGYFDQYLDKMYRFDPLHARFAENRDVVRLTDEIQRTASSEAALFAEFCGECDVADSIEFFFRVDGKLLAGMNFAWRERRHVPVDLMPLSKKLHDYVECNLRPHLTCEIGHSIRNAWHLTRREIEVLELLCCGRANQEIAQSLFISLATVKTHLNKIFLKLGAETRAAAVAIALRANK